MLSVVEEAAGMKRGYCADEEDYDIPSRDTQEPRIQDSDVDNDYTSATSANKEDKVWSEYCKEHLEPQGVGRDWEQQPLNINRGSAMMQFPRHGQPQQQQPQQQPQQQFVPPMGSFGVGMGQIPTGVQYINPNAVPQILMQGLVQGLPMPVLQVPPQNPQFPFNPQIGIQQINGAVIQQQQQQVHIHQPQQVLKTTQQQVQQFTQSQVQSTASGQLPVQQQQQQVWTSEDQQNLGVLLHKKKVRMVRKIKRAGTGMGMGTGMNMIASQQLPAQCNGHDKDISNRNVQQVQVSVQPPNGKRGSKRMSRYKAAVSTDGKKGDANTNANSNTNSNLPSGGLQQSQQQQLQQQQLQQQQTQQQCQPKAQGIMQAQQQFQPQQQQMQFQQQQFQLQQILQQQYQQLLNQTNWQQCWSQAFTEVINQLQHAHALLGQPPVMQNEGFAAFINGQSGFVGTNVSTSNENRQQFQNKQNPVTVPVKSQDLACGFEFLESREEIVPYTKQQGKNKCVIGEYKAAKVKVKAPRITAAGTFLLPTVQLFDPQQTLVGMQDIQDVDEVFRKAFGNDVYNSCVGEFPNLFNPQPFGQNAPPNVMCMPTNQALTFGAGVVLDNNQNQFRMNVNTSTLQPALVQAYNQCYPLQQPQLQMQPQPPLHPQPSQQDSANRGVNPPPIFTQQTGIPMQGQQQQQQQQANVGDVAHFPIPPLLSSAEQELLKVVNKPDKFGRMGIHVAAASGELNILARLVQLGVDTSVVVQSDWGSAQQEDQSIPIKFSFRGCTASHLAAHFGHLEAVQYLHQCNPNLAMWRDVHGRFPIHCATAQGHQDIVHFFLSKAKLDLNKLDGWCEEGKGVSALHVAAAKGYRHIASMLWPKYQNIQQQDWKGRAPLHWAAVNGHIGVVEELVIAGSGVQLCDNSGFTAAHLAAMMGHFEIVEKLIGAGFVVDSMGSSECQCTALHLAASFGKAEVVYNLLQHKADPNKLDGNHYTALYYAAEGGCWQVYSLLSKYCNPLDRPENCPVTILHLAAQGGNQKIYNDLVERGWDEKMLTQEGATVLHYAARGKVGLTRMLLEQRVLDVDVVDFKQRTPLHYASDQGLSDVMELLLKFGADLEARGTGGWTPLHYIAVRGLLEPFNFLLEQGANIRYTDDSQRTVLHLAVGPGGSQESVRQILSLEAGKELVNAQDNLGDTALHIVCEDGVKEYLSMLFQYKADVNITNSLRRTPLHAVFSPFRTSVPTRTRTSKIDPSPTCQSTPIILPLTPSPTRLTKDQEDRVMDITLKLVASGANLLARDSDEVCPLHLIAQHCSSAFFQQMFELAKSSDPDAPGIKDKIGRSLLHYAIEGGRDGTVSFLLERGACNHDDRAGGTGSMNALHWACRMGNADMVSKLLDMGYDSMARGPENRTPLHYVAWSARTAITYTTPQQNRLSQQSQIDQTSIVKLDFQNQMKIYSLLVDRGADVNAVNSLQQNALFGTCCSGNVQMFEALTLKGVAYNVRDTLGQTPLHYAAMYGQADIVLRLLQQGCRWNVESPESNMIPLQFAADHGYVSCLRYLLQPLLVAGGGSGQIRIQDSEKYKKYVQDSLTRACERRHIACIFELLNVLGGCTAPEKKQNVLHLACIQNNELAAQAVVKVFREQGNNLNEQDADHNAPIHYAAMSGCQGCVSCLCEGGADPHISNSEGNQPLHKAALHGQPQCCEELIRYGAEVDARNSQGCTPLHLAASAGGLETVHKLLENNASVDLKNGQNNATALHCAAQNGHEKVVEVLLEQGACVDSLNGQEMTPLQVAGSGGYSNICEILAKAGAELDSQSNNGSTALHNASSNGHLDTVERLVRLGVDLDVMNHNGNTALHVAAFKGYADICSLLCEKGAEITIRNSKGYTALHCAASNGHMETAEKLVKAGIPWRESSKDTKTDIDIVKSIARKTNKGVDFVKGRFSLSEKYAKKQAALQAAMEVENNQPDEEELRKKRAEAEKVALELIMEEELQKRKEEAKKDKRKKKANKKKKDRDTGDASPVDSEHQPESESRSQTKQQQSDVAGGSSSDELESLSSVREVSQPTISRPPVHQYTVEAPPEPKPMQKVLPKSSRSNKQSASVHKSSAPAQRQASNPAGKQQQSSSTTATPAQTAKKQIRISVLNVAKPGVSNSTSSTNNQVKSDEPKSKRASQPPPQVHNQSKQQSTVQSDPLSKKSSSPSVSEASRKGSGATTSNSSSPVAAKQPVTTGVSSTRAIAISPTVQQPSAPAVQQPTAPPKLQTSRLLLVKEPAAAQLPPKESIQVQNSVHKGDVAVKQDKQAVSSQDGQDTAYQEAKVMMEQLDIKGDKKAPNQVETQAPIVYQSTSTGVASSVATPAYTQVSSQQSVPLVPFSPVMSYPQNVRGVSSAVVAVSQGHMIPNPTAVPLPPPPVPLRRVDIPYSHVVDGTGQMAMMGGQDPSRPIAQAYAPMQIPIGSFPSLQSSPYVNGTTMRMQTQQMQQQHHQQLKRTYTTGSLAQGMALQVLEDVGTAPSSATPTPTPTPAPAPASAAPSMVQAIPPPPGQPLSIQVQRPYAQVVHRPPPYPNELPASTASFTSGAIQQQGSNLPRGNGQQGVQQAINSLPLSEKHFETVFMHNKSDSIWGGFKVPDKVVASKMTKNGIVDMAVATNSPDKRLVDRVRRKKGGARPVYPYDILLRLDHNQFEDAKSHGYICPITGRLMHDPVQASDGANYERTAFVERLKKSNISPMTGQPFISTVVESNVKLYFGIKQWLTRNGLYSSEWQDQE